MLRSRVMVLVVLLALVVASGSVAAARSRDARDSDIVREPTEADFQAIMRLREALGLQHDRDYVESTEASSSARIPDGPAGQMSIKLTPAELAVVDERFALQDQVSAVDREAFRSFAASYSGAFLMSDEVTGRSEFHLAFTDISEQGKDRLRGVVSPEFRDRIVFDKALYSLTELLEQQEAVEFQLTMRGLTFGGSSVDERTNRVVVYSDDPRVLEFVETNYPHQVSIEPGSYGTPTIDKNDPLPYALVIGGQAIGVVQDQTDLRCTSGFAVQSGFGPFILTAGHCADHLDQQWFQGGSAMGTVEGRGPPVVATGRSR